MGFGVGFWFPFSVVRLKDVMDLISIARRSEVGEEESNHNNGVAAAKGKIKTKLCGISSPNDALNVLWKMLPGGLYKERTK